MIPKECKRIAEVDFPIAEVSKHSAREKSIRHGHPSTLHLWWARRPLAACRAMLLGLLLPDPCDPHCPEEFKERARNLLPQIIGIIGGKDEDLRKAILRFIGEFANWDVSSHPVYLEVSRGLVKAAHPEEPPLVVDPFAGGGSIPLEALRLGCEAFASDLNPVACLILKVMLEDIPRHGPELAEELRKVGGEIKKQAEKELKEFYPNDPDGSTPIAYLWARTVRCESPNCGAEIPLMRSFWLCKKANRKRALRYEVVRPQRDVPCVEFKIFEPKTEKEVSEGTVTRAKAKCLCCGTVLTPERVRAQLSEQRGGADVIFDKKGNHIGGARMLAVVTLKPDEQGRHYRLPTDRDYEAVWKAQKQVVKIFDEWEKNGKKGLCPFPDEPTPSKNTHRAVGSQLHLYGINTFADLFTARQKVSISVFVKELNNFCKENSEVLNLLSTTVGRLADASSNLTSWLASGEEIKHVFSRQALPIVWDFGETNPTSCVSRSWTSSLKSIVNVLHELANANLLVGQVQQSDSCNSPLPDATSYVWFTDPPYYDAIPYSNLSDFFFVWQKRTLANHLLYDNYDANNPLTPKLPEIVQCEKVKDKNGNPKDKAFYEKSMTKAFFEGRRVLKDEGIGSVVFAHKTTEGWEALLTGMIKGGWTITGSWPISTEMGSRLNARDTASLATSVHLVCRPRPEDASIGDWGVVLNELPKRVGDWMERLQSEGVRGADLVFACIGPALEIFSRYSTVETAEGDEVKLSDYLMKVWEVVGRIALEQVLGTAEAKARNGASGALEEDARLTALFLWTLQATNGKNGSNGNSREKSSEEDDEDEEETSRGKVKGFSLIFDVVRRFAQPLGINLPKWEKRIIETKKGVVRLLPVSERAKQLFGEDKADAVADWILQEPNKDFQQYLLPEMEEDRTPQARKRGKRKINIDSSDIETQTEQQATTLDRVHAAMLLQAGGQANALRTLIKTEISRGPDFLRLSNALSALYPKGSEEKRLLDAMLLAAPR
ncbi:MAG: DUF1156 domain-containing protein [Candidatus Omnitrophota bacterium]|jgi:adenine-specific DNA methylase|nr:MAG: DUF1156 domain-containing protein [Candidatus Omnitrophota bacterium]